jgi:hypothetical protein
VTCRPGHPPRHEPFEKGNRFSVVSHGASSPRAIAARAAEIHDALLDAAPYLAEDRFLPAVSRYLSAAAREALLHDHITRVSQEKGVGAVPVRLWPEATAAARLAAKLGSDLGLDPHGYARIRALSVGANVGQATLADLAATGKAIRERRDAELAAEALEEGGDA